MSENKYEIYRVPLSLALENINTEYEQAKMCGEFVLNTINADRLIKLITFKDGVINAWKDYFSDFLLIENLTTEQFCYFFIALWAIGRINYYGKTKKDPVSLRLNTKIIDELLESLIMRSSWGDSIYTEEFQKLWEEYPAPFKANNNVECAALLLFSDMWSRATNQVVPLDLLLLTN